MNITVQIVHDELKGGEYRLLADYLRMNGFFVYNQIVKPNQTLFNLNQKFDFTIVIGLDNWEGKEIVTKGFDNTICLDEEKPINDNPVSFDPNWKKRYLMNCLEVMYNNNIITDEELYVMKVTAAVYGDHDLLRANLTLTSFFHDAIIMKDTLAIYDEALTVHNATLGPTLYRARPPFIRAFYRDEYFRITLMKLVNESCNLSHKRMVFDTKTIPERIDEEFGEKWDLLKPEKEGAALNFLQGLACKVDPETRFYSGSYFIKALEKLGNKAYAGYVNYLLGQYLEKVLQSSVNARPYYKIAHELRPNDCKAPYKLAFIKSYYGEDYISSLMYLHQIIQILENKEANNILEPKEYLMLFQTYHMLHIIYDKILRKKQSMNMRERKYNILELASDNNNRNFLYDQLFGIEPFRGHQGTEIPTKMLMRERLVHAKLPDKSKFR